MVAAAVEKFTASDVKERLRGRHPGQGGRFPGAWTCIEEWRGIDLLAFSAWASQGAYGRVGYEVKVSRSDLRSELLRPHKRSGNVAWCNEFYFAVPDGLLTADELAYREPEWTDSDWFGERCPGFAGQPCSRGWKRNSYTVRVPIPTSERWRPHHESVPCPTCNGKGFTTPSRVEQEAPRCWVPRDVGLVVVDGRCARVVRKSPRRKDVPAMSARELGQFVRWVSMRPDPRHGL